jgi:hypothetical protein
MFIESGCLIIKGKILPSSGLGLSIGPIFKCQAVQEEEEEDLSQPRQKLVLEEWLTKSWKTKSPFLAGTEPHTDKFQAYVLSSPGFYGAESWTLRKVHQKHPGSFKMWCWRRMEKIIWTDRVRNEKELHRVKEERISYIQ